MRLICGDCLDVLPTLDSESVDAVITDPPYGIDYQSARRTDSEARLPKVKNDKLPFIWWLYHAYRVTKSPGSLVCFCDWRVQDTFKMAIEAAGYDIKSQVIWDRGWHGLGDLNGQFAPQHDVIWFATKGKFVFKNGRPKSVIQSRRLAAQDLSHPTEKPVALMRHLVRSVTGFWDVVLDPMMGSGSTGTACAQERRDFIGIEMDGDYYKLAERRITQAQPALEGLA